MSNGDWLPLRARIAELEEENRRLTLENRKLRDYDAMQRAQSAPRTIGDLMGCASASHAAPFPRRAMR
jgi:hypothetical protein